MVEWDGLENRCTLRGYRGFESHPLRLPAFAAFFGSIWKSFSRLPTHHLPGAIFLVIALAGALSAQPFYGVVYRPHGVKYDVLETEHFRVIYQRELDSLAARVAAVAEDDLSGSQRARRTAESVSSADHSQRVQ